MDDTSINLSFVKEVKLIDLSLQNYIQYRDDCWKEHKTYKEIKDKILFFIGTLFTTAFIGAGYILLQMPTTTISNVYFLQYIILHLFFLVLYLYYQYNRLISDMYLMEVNCCEKFIKTKNPEWNSFSTLKNDYIYSYSSSKRFKHLANIALVCNLLIFSSVPLIFKFTLISFLGTSIIINWVFIICSILFGVGLKALDNYYRDSSEKVKLLVERKWQSRL